MNKSVLFLIGVTHRTAPFEFREKVSMPPAAEAQFIQKLAAVRHLHEFVVLSTCNRVEIYGVAEDDCVLCRVTTALCDHRQVPLGDFDRFGFVIRDREAIEHLLVVASGIDSQILGENEIFGQVKRAYGDAQARGSVGAVLNRVFQKTFQAAKLVRNKTAVASGQVSIANVAVDLAADIFGSVKNTTVLLIGAGKMAEKSGRAFVSRGVKSVTVSSRSPERAARLAAELGGQALPFEEREAYLGRCDIVVCSAAAPDLVVSCAAVAAAMNQRKTRPLLLADLAMPRNIDPAVSGSQNVFLFNLDDLAARAQKNRQLRMLAADRGRQLLIPRAAMLWQQVELQIGQGPAGATAMASELILGGGVSSAGLA